MQPTRLTELLKIPKHWTRSAVARTAEGTSTHHNDPEAVCWCLGGGVELLYNGDDSFAKMMRIMWKIIRERFPGRTHPTKADKLAGYIGTVARFNDNAETTHEEVLSVATEAEAEYYREVPSEGGDDKQTGGS